MKRKTADLESIMSLLYKTEDEQLYLSIKEDLAAIPYKRSVYAKILLTNIAAVFLDDDMKNALLVLAKDRNSDVRINALDTLGMYPDEAVCLALQDHAENDPHYLARAYSIVSYSEVCAQMGIDANAARVFVNALLRRERYCINKVSCLEGLCILGENRVSDILSYYGHADIHSKHIVLNALDNVMHTSGIDEIKKFLEKQRQNCEETPVIAQKISELQKRCRGCSEDISIGSRS